MGQGVLQQQPGILEPGPLALQPTGAQIFKGGFANAPMTIAVDTGERMMNAMGLQPSQSSATRPSAGPRSASPGRQGKAQQQGNQPSITPNVKVNIVKSG